MDDQFEQVRHSLGWFLDERLAEVIRKGTECQVEHQLEALVVASEMEEMLQLALEVTRNYPSLERVALPGPNFGNQVNAHVQCMNATRARIQLSLKQSQELQDLTLEIQRLEEEENQLELAIQERMVAERELERRRRDLERRKQLESQQPDIRRIIESITAEAATLNGGVGALEELGATSSHFTSLLEEMRERVDQEVQGILDSVAEASAQLHNASAQSELQIAELKRVEKETAEYVAETGKLRTETESKALLLRQARQLFDEQRRDLDAHVMANQEVANALGISNPSGTLDQIETRLREIGTMISETDKALGDVVRDNQERAKMAYQPLV